MNNTSKPLTVRILEKDYRIACPPEEQAILFRTADYVNQAMVQVKKSSQSLSTERVAVLAALNIARELIENNPTSLQQPMHDTHAEELIERIDAALQEFGHP
jgi:cell division protein ZapA